MLALLTGVLPQGLLSFPAGQVLLSKAIGCHDAAQLCLLQVGLALMLEREPQQGSLGALADWARILTGESMTSCWLALQCGSPLKFLS